MKKILLTLLLFMFIYCANSAAVDIFDAAGFNAYFGNNTGSEAEIFNNLSFNSNISTMGNFNKTIDGRNHSLSGSGNRGLYISAGNSAVKLTLKDITLENMNIALWFYTGDNKTADFEGNITFQNNNNSQSTGNRGGGAVRINDRRNINLNFNSANVNFLNNTSSESRALANEGGAIYLSAQANASFIDSNVVFAENKALNPGAGNGNGGAIYLEGMYTTAKISLINFSTSIVEFSNNQAKTYGGAISVNTYSSATFINSSVTFFNNQALSNNSYGGAIYISAGISSLNFIDGTVTFTSNSAVSFGGAIYAASGAKIDFSGSTVTAVGNSALNGYG
jgi:predicted outer membrane repeat protein